MLREGDGDLLGAAQSCSGGEWGWRRCAGPGVVAAGALAQPVPCGAAAVDHVVPDPECSLAEALERWREWADGNACCDYALHVDIPRWSDRVRQELHALVQEKGLAPTAHSSRCPSGTLRSKSPTQPPLPSALPLGVNSFMVYMAYKDLYQMSNTEVRPHLLPCARGSGGMAAVRVQRPCAGQGTCSAPQSFFLLSFLAV